MANLALSSHSAEQQGKSARSEGRNGHRLSRRFSDFAHLVARLSGTPAALAILLAALVILAVAVHYGIRNLAARTLVNPLRTEAAAEDIRGDLVAAFLRNTKPWRSIFAPSPAGWGGAAKRRLHKVRQDADGFVQTLNDRFTNPSGESLAEVNEPKEAQARG